MNVAMTVYNANSGQRIVELDVLRGFAVLGIFWINIVYMGLPYGAGNLPTLIGNHDALNVFAWVINSLFIDGSMFALFAMLFGASALILLREEKLNTADGVDVVDRYYRRLFWLMVFGLIHSFILLWPLDILFSYAVLGLLLFPLRKLRPVNLLMLGLVLVVIGCLGLNGDAEDNTNTNTDTAEQSLTSDTTSVNIAADITLGSLTEQALADTNAVNELKDELYKELAENLLARKQGYIELFKDNIALAVGQHTTNLYEDNIYDAGGMMLIGMALFKWGVLSGLRSSLFYLVLMFTGYGIAMVMRYPFVSEFIAVGFEPGKTPGANHAFFFFARLPLALGHLGLVMLLLRMEWFKLPSAMLSAAGRMALTNFIMQTVFAIFLFYSFGLAMFGELERYQLSLIALTFALFQLGFSVLWLSKHNMGPLEWLWRWLTNLRSGDLTIVRKISLRRAPNGAGHI